MSPAAPSNSDVAAQFELLADLIELEGGDSFRINAYRRAAKQILDSSRSVAELARTWQATELPGIGKTIEGKIREIARDGKIHALAELEQRVPAGVVSFLRLPGIGPRTAARFWIELGLTTPEELRRAAEQGRLRTLPGLGSSIETKVLRALERAAEPGERRLLLGQALPAALEVRDQIAGLAEAVRVSEAGSVRRRRETVHDVDLIATSTEPVALIEKFTTLDWVAKVAGAGETKAEVVGQNGLHFD